MIKIVLSEQSKQHLLRSWSKLKLLYTVKLGPRLSRIIQLISYYYNVIGKIVQIINSANILNFS